MILAVNLSDVQRIDTDSGNDCIKEPHVNIDVGEIFCPSDIVVDIESLTSEHTHTHARTHTRTRARARTKRERERGREGEFGGGGGAPS